MNPAHEDRAPQRPNRSAFARAALVALGLFVVFGAIAYALNPDRGPEAVGYVLGGTLLAYLVTTLVAFLSRRPWGWGRYVAVMLPIYLVATLLSRLGQMP